jgi:hypothetical protein
MPYLRMNSGFSFLSIKNDAKINNIVGVCNYNLNESKISLVIGDKNIVNLL